MTFQTGYEKLSAYAHPKSQHGLSKNFFDKRALKAIYQLEQKGYQGFIVGGAIRDLLCGIKPKDFDIVTDAQPEEVHKIFNNSRIIGRRFRLVHLHYGRETLEVATFRAHHNEESSTGKDSSNQSKVSRNGLLVRDNVFGTIQEDAERRDFTINALYYSPTTECIYDFANSLADITNKEINIIGNPDTRFQEDPVRMLRAQRFASKLDFSLNTGIENSILKNAHLLRNISNARLFDESIKVFHSEHALNLVHRLQNTGLFEVLFPSFCNNANSENWEQKLLDAALINTQERILHNKPVTIAFIYAVLLWPEFIRNFPIESIQNRDLPKLTNRALSLIRQQSQITMIPKRHAYAIKDIWEFQIRLQKRMPKRVQWLLQQRRFRAAFDLLILREKSGEISPTLGLGNWWQEIQFASPEAQQRLIEQLPADTAPRRKRKYNKNRSKSKPAASKQQNA